jgi:hypothetical protein
MLTPPDGLPSDLLESTLATGWGVTAESLIYLPVGFGSHHWEVCGADGSRWFATVDDLDARRWSQQESLDSVFARLRASLSVAAALSGLGMKFALAPMPASSGEPLLRLTDGFSLALYPFVTGQSFEWGEFPTQEHRRETLDLVVAIHTAPVSAGLGARTDDLVIQGRDELEAGLDAATSPATETSLTAGTGGTDLGPYAQRAGDLISACQAPIRQLLVRYDALVAQVGAGSVPMVLTHGEPHPGNTMLTSAGWLLIDWDTALIAPPERDLCNLDPGDGSMLAAYEQATGVAPRPAALELYQLRWKLTDIALFAAQFRAPHTGDANDEESFDLLCALLDHLTD